MSKFKVEIMVPVPLLGPVMEHLLKWHNIEDNIELLNCYLVEEDKEVKEESRIITPTTKQLLMNVMRSKDYRPMTSAELSAALNLTEKHERQRVWTVLSDWKKQGIVRRLENGEFELINRSLSSTG